MWYIYTVTNQLNQKQYVGVCANPANRWTDHQRNGVNQFKGWPLYVAIKEDGIEHFTFNIIATALTKREGHIAEAEAIRTLNTLVPNGYNQRVEGTPLPNEHATHIRDALRQPGVRAVIAEKLKRISNEPAMRKKRATFTGRHHTPETRQKLRERHKSLTWITNGVDNKKIAIGQPIPDGWRHGLTQWWIK